MQHCVLSGSVDGYTWHLLAEAPPPAFGEVTFVPYNQDLPKLFKGSKEIWIKINLYSYGTSASAGGSATNTAQHSRYDSSNPKTTFKLDVTFESSTSAVSAIDLNSHTGILEVELLINSLYNISGSFAPYNFSGVEDAFEKTLTGLQHAKNAGISFQINTTVSKHNVDELEEIFNLAVRLGAITFDVFLLVPIGRGAALKHLELSPEIYEKTLNRIADIADKASIRVKTTCAPHYSRIQRQKEKKTNAYMGNGCMAGREFVFISHRGIVQPCGFLDLPCGNLRESTFKEIYEKSEIFLNLRKVDDYNGKCGVCEFRFVCGGCRARAYAHSGDYLDEEPFCVYNPGKKM